MNIPGPEMRPDSRADLGIQSGTARKPEAAPVTPQQRAAAEAAFFMRDGTALSESARAALESELAALGFRQAELTPELLSRAALLQRHGIPLAAGLLRDVSGADVLAEQTVQLRNEIAAALDNPRLPGSIRTALVEFLRQTDALFAAPGDRTFIGESADALLDLKTVTLERLFRLAGGNPDAIPGFLAEGTTESRIAFELAAGLTGGTGSGNRGEAQAVRDAMNVFRAAIGGLLHSGQVDRARFDQLFSTLADRLLAATDHAIVSSGGGLSDTAAGLLAGFVRDSLNDLKIRLTSLVFDDGPVAAYAGGAAMPGLRTLMRRSGFGFEWRLLMWYRTGRDPARLHALVRDDYKGMLMQLAARLRQDSGARLSKLAALEHKARELLDTITRGQIDMLPGNRNTTRDAVLPVPLAPGGMESLRLNRRDGGEPANQPASPETPVVFAVTTSELGTVNVALRPSGQQLSLSLGFADERTREYAAGGGDELRDALAARGYDVGALVFSLTPRETAADTGQIQSGGDRA